jgi:hypothetical protein
MSRRNPRFAARMGSLLLGGAVLVSGVALAQTPQRKPGLWQQTISSTGAGMPSQTMSMCTDEKVDDLIAARGSQNQSCEQQSVRRDGKAFVVDSVCRSGKTTVRTHGRFSGDFNTQYTGELRSTFEPPMQGMKEMTQKIEARWIGPCKPGQKPGDISMDGMGGMNMNELMNADPAKMKEMMQQMQRMQQSPAR